MNKNRNISCEGIVLRVIKYKNHHAIFPFITPNYGVIQCSVRGLNNVKSNLAGAISNLNYLNLELTKPGSSDIYNVKNADLISPLANVNNLECFKYQSAGGELFTKIDSYLEEDYAELFRLLLNYLTFLPTIKKNQIAIFWRFLIHYYYILGIPFNLQECSECHEKLVDSIYYSFDNHSLVCPNCASVHKIKQITVNTQNLLKQLPTIGKIIEEITIDEPTKKEINEILLSHLSHSLNKEFYLRSIRF